MLVAHVALVFAFKLVFPSMDLFSMLVGTTISGFDAIPPMLGLAQESYHGGGIFHSVWVPLLGAAVIYPFGELAAFSFLLGGLLHLAADSIDALGRPWLYPIYKKPFRIALLPYDFRAYISNPVSVSLEVVSCVFVLYNLVYVGVDERTLLWILLIAPLFVTFAVHHWRSRPQ